MNGPEVYTPETAAEVLKTHGRAIAHMRERQEIGRFGLVLGAGVSKGLGLPNWTQLLDRIANHPDVNAPDLTRKDESETYRSQMLYQHYRVKRTNEAQNEGIALGPYDIEVAWKQLVHSCLYSGVDAEAVQKQAYYLHKFLPIVAKSPLTVNYNFDDSIQRMLLQQMPIDEARTSRGYSTIWSERVQIGPNRAVIYHPNGFLPYKLTEQLSDNLVFLEKSFADQLVDSTAGQYSTLANHFAQSTCLFIGLSMHDTTLRYMLRQCARIHPGHYHYYVSYVHKGEKPDYARRQAEFDANFAVHNLVTLFLNESELAALGDLLCMDGDDYCARVRELNVPVRYRFFLAGPVGVGKTTALSNFRSIRNYEEWLEPLLETMAKDPRGLSPEELAEIDQWVDGQLEKKNSLLLTDKCGIDMVDRGPLDAFAFVEEAIWPDRAKAIRLAIQGRYSGRKLVGGHMILLKGDTSVLYSRARRILRFPSQEGLERQQAVLERIYSCTGPTPAVTIVDTRNKSAAEVATEISEIVHKSPYVEFDFQRRLEEIERGKFD